MVVQSFQLLLIKTIAHGPYTGGTEVLVRGNGFTENTTVLFGGRFVEPLDLLFVDSRRILVYTPPGDPGLADVEVRREDLSATLADGYEFEAIAVDPGSGSVAGGTYITISGFGTHFDDTTIVTFDGTPMTGVNVVNPQQLTGFSPPGVAAISSTKLFMSHLIYNNQNNSASKKPGRQRKLISN